MFSSAVFRSAPLTPFSAARAARSFFETAVNNLDRSPSRPTRNSRCLPIPVISMSIPCHKTLDGDKAVCRGFWNRHKRDSLGCRLGAIIGVIEVDPEENR